MFKIYHNIAKTTTAGAGISLLPQLGGGSELNNIITFSGLLLLLLFVISQLFVVYLKKHN